MTTNTRAECPICGRCVAVCLNGALRQHRDANRVGCPGGGRNHSEEAREVTRPDLAADDCAVLGMAHIWQAVSIDDSPSGRLLRDTVAALARCLVETGTYPLVADLELVSA